MDEKQTPTHVAIPIGDYEAALAMIYDLRSGVQLPLLRLLRNEQVAVMHHNAPSRSTSPTVPGSMPPSAMQPATE